MLFPFYARLFSNATPCRECIAFLLTKLVVSRVSRQVKETLSYGMTHGNGNGGNSRNGKARRRNEWEIIITAESRAVCNNLPIARAALLTQQNRPPSYERYENERMGTREKRRFHLANFINFAISWQRSNDGSERRKGSVYSLVCDLAQNPFRKSQNTFRTSRGFPECYFVLLLKRTANKSESIQLETRHTDDTFHTK